jgi:hypothetical protein
MLLHHHLSIYSESRSNVGVTIQLCLPIGEHPIHYPNPVPIVDIYLEFGEMEAVSIPGKCPS